MLQQIATNTSQGLQVAKYKKNCKKQVVISHTLRGFQPQTCKLVVSTILRLVLGRSQAVCKVF